MDLQTAKSGANGARIDTLDTPAAVAPIIATPTPIASATLAAPTPPAPPAASTGPGTPPVAAGGPFTPPRTRPRPGAPAKAPPRALTIREWPESERPREKLLERGAQALSDAELLALLLGSGIKGRSAVDVARSLIADFGSLRELLSADRPRWEAQLGIGPARYATLMASIELARRHFREPLRSSSALSAPDFTRRFLLAQLRDRPYEVFCCLFLDNRHRLIAFEELFRGTIDGASVHPREVVRQALLHNAASVIIAHNHPSGVADPSQADEGVTRRIRQALALVDVRLLDHLIVGDGRCYSFSEHGLL
ncbi:MAG TPA: DNA repair protein RadC [Steroidobacteraceae bacterium]|jgi:DNA repair protein RadC|nr:DNA repair protein RadC [Steroidobacteraceae bacterium]